MEAPSTPAPPSSTMKVANTSNITCPATMLANKRMDKDTGRDR